MKRSDSDSRVWAVSLSGKEFVGAHFPRKFLPETVTSVSPLVILAIQIVRVFTDLQIIFKHFLIIFTIISIFYMSKLRLRGTYPPVDRQLLSSKSYGAGIQTWVFWSHSIPSSGSFLHSLTIPSLSPFLTPLLIPYVMPSYPWDSLYSHIPRLASPHFPDTPGAPHPWSKKSAWTNSQSSFQLRMDSGPDSVVFSSVFLAPRVLYKAPHFISDPRPPERSKGSNEKREVLDSGDDVWSRTGASPEGTKGEEEKWQSTPQRVAVTR